MTLPIERFKDSYQNWRYNPFTAADMAIDKEEDGLIIPSGSPFVIQLLEQARYNDPTSVSVRSYGVSTTVDETSASGQKVLKVAATAGFSPGDNIIINRGGAREEEKIIDTIQAGISLTVTVNLEYEHTVGQADVVEKFIAFTETAGAPAQSQFRVDYPPDDGEGTGLVEFNSNDADKEVRVNYKATGSPALAETLDTKISYPTGAPADNQIVGFSSGAPYWLQLPHANLAGVSADQHHAQVHTHASHSGIGANDHHAQSHSLASHSTKPHSALTGVSANQHHPQTHTLGSHSDFSTYLDQAVKQASSVIFANLTANGKFAVGASTELTLSGNAITVTRSYHSIDTEGGAGNDNLDKINGGVAGMILVIRPESGIRNITVRDQGTSGENIWLEDNLTFLMTTVRYKLYLFCDGANWYEISRFRG